MLTSSPLLQHFHTSIFRALKVLNATPLVSGQRFPSAAEEERLNWHLESQRLERQGPDSKPMFNLPASIISIIQGFYCNNKKLRKNRILRQKAQTQSKVLRKIRLQKNPNLRTKHYFYCSVNSSHHWNTTNCIESRVVTHSSTVNTPHLGSELPCTKQVSLSALKNQQFMEETEFSVIAPKETLCSLWRGHGEPGEGLVRFLVNIKQTDHYLFYFTL